MVSASKHVTAAVALGLAMTALATPSFAQLREGGEGELVTVGVDVLSNRPSRHFWSRTPAAYSRAA